MDRHKQTVHMKYGQCVYKHVAGLPAPIPMKHLGVAQQIAVAEHGPFAASGGATGVDDGSDIVCLPEHGCVLVTVVCSALQQTATALIIQGHHILRP